jgi:nitrogen fixation NifU-like protein
MASSDMYKENILDLYRHPLNKRELKSPTAKATKNNPLCGDAITIYLREKAGKIEEVSFQGTGCAISQAAASLATELVKGKTRKEALAITDEDMLGELGIEVSYARRACALLALNVVRKALAEA